MIMNPYHEESRARTSSEIEEIDTPTSGTFIYSSPRMDNADSAGGWRPPAPDPPEGRARGTRSALLKVF